MPRIDCGARFKHPLHWTLESGITLIRHARREGLQFEIRSDSDSTYGRVAINQPGGIAGVV